MGSQLSGGHRSFQDSRTKRDDCLISFVAGIQSKYSALTGGHRGTVGKGFSTHRGRRGFLCQAGIQLSKVQAVSKESPGSDSSSTDSNRGSERIIWNVVVFFTRITTALRTAGTRARGQERLRSSFSPGVLPDLGGMPQTVVPPRVRK
jgi:hypothetical protein